MKYVIAFAVLGILLSWTAISHGGWWYVLLWCAVSFFGLSVGYAGIGSRVFCKTPDGRIPVWAKITHSPFMLYSAAMWHLVRLLSREEAYNSVSDDLIVGRRLLAGELPAGIVNVVDLTAEVEDPYEIRKTTHYVSLPILDGSVPTRQALRSTIRKLSRGMTFVHCAQGHGRTGLFALAVLAERDRIQSFDEGMSLIKQARPGISLNTTQEKFIKKYIAEHVTKSVAATRAPEAQRSPLTQE